MAIHGHLPRIAKPKLKLMRWTEARELVKIDMNHFLGFSCSGDESLADELPASMFRHDDGKPDYVKSPHFRRGDV